MRRTAHIAYIARIAAPCRSGEQHRDARTRYIDTRQTYHGPLPLRCKGASCTVRSAHGPALCSPLHRNRSPASEERARSEETLRRDSLHEEASRRTRKHHDGREPRTENREPRTTKTDHEDEAYAAHSAHSSSAHTGLSGDGVAVRTHLCAGCHRCA